jgi:hypothetical protein
MVETRSTSSSLPEIQNPVINFERDFIDYEFPDDTESEMSEEGSNLKQAPQAENSNVARLPDNREEEENTNGVRVHDLLSQDTVDDDGAERRYKVTRDDKDDEDYNSDCLNDSDDVLDFDGDGNDSDFDPEQNNEESESESVVLVLSKTNPAAINLRLWQNWTEQKRKKNLAWAFFQKV